MYTVKGKIEQDNLVQEYLPVVRRQALSLQVKLPANVELDDLIQAGMMGLLDALGRFDAAAGNTFMSFASQRIRGAMIDELRSRDWLPRSVRRSARAVDECVQLLEQRLGRPPREPEIAAELEMSLEDYRQVLHDTNNGFLLPYEELLEEGLEPETTTRSHSSPLEQLFSDERKGMLTEAIDALPEREKLLLALYYQEELNLKEIGAVLGVTESRVCQLHSQAISRIRSRLSRMDEE